MVGAIAQVVPDQEQAIDLVLGQNQLARQILSENMVLIYPNTTSKQKDYQDQIVKTFYLNTAAPKDVSDLLKTVTVFWWGWAESNRRHAV